MRINRIFADAFNYLLYDGKAVIDPDGLHELDSTELAALFSDYDSSTAGTSCNDSANVETVQKYRDVLKSAVIKQDDNASYMILGIENQTQVNYAIAVKNIIYDALQYGKQVREIAGSHRKDSVGFKGRSRAEFLSGFCKDDYLRPVITLVIHFGADAWDGPLSLHDMIRFDNPGLKKFVQDYRIHLIDPAQLSDEELLKFSTSLREVLQYIKYSNDINQLEKITSNNQRMLIDINAAQVIATLTDTPVDISDNEEVVNMCQAIKEMIEKAQAEGLQLAQDMQAWLKEQGRIDDIMQTISDDDFRDQMINDYKASLKQS